jgi:hypothetical protein
MYSDNETDDDLLGFDDQVEDLLSLVLEPDLLPITVGVLGDWGSGKSSLLLMAAKRLREQGVLVIEFSPWRIESYDDAKTAFLAAVVDAVAEALPDDDANDPSRLDRARAAVKSLHKRVRWMRVAGLAAKHVVTMTAPSLDDLDGLLRDDKAAPEAASSESVSRDFHAEFEALVASLDRPAVVVLVDDLDRCMPEQVLDVLQAIRLFLAVRGTAFVLATDERVVRDAVRLRYPQATAGTETDLPREYLEKIIQVPIRIPPIGAAEAETYLNLLVAKAHLTGDQLTACKNRAREVRTRGLVAVAMNLGLAREAVSGPLPAAAESEFELMGRIAQPLGAGLKGNPRQIKRYLNAFEMRSRTATRRGLDDAIDRGVLAKLMVLEYARPRFLNELNRWQAEEGGRSKRLGQIEDASRPRTQPPTSDGSSEDKPAKAKLSSVPPAPAVLSAELKSWVDDPWVASWARMDPPLAGIDLQPYLELARAALPALAVLARALPERLQALLTKLSHAEEVIREGAIKEVVEAPAEDVAALAEAALDRLGSLAEPQALALSLVDLAVAHPAHLTAAIAGLKSLPYGPLKPALPTLLESRLRGSTAAPDLRTILEGWAVQDTNPRLRKAAELVLNAPAG